VTYYCAECCTSTEDKSYDKETLVKAHQGAYFVSSATFG